MAKKIPEIEPRESGGSRVAQAVIKKVRENKTIASVATAALVIFIIVALTD